MSDEYSQPTLELSRTFEGWWLPRRPLCCDDDYAALRRRSRADALRCKHIEANPSALVNTIVVALPRLKTFASLASREAARATSMICLAASNSSVPWLLHHSSRFLTSALAPMSFPRIAAGSGVRRPGRRVRNVLLRDLIRTDRVESMEYLQRIARTRRQLIADVEGSEPETAGILLAHIDELGQALNQHYRPAQSRFSGDSDQ